MLLYFALRNLSRHRRRTLVSLSALVLGTAAVVTSRGFINSQHRLMLEGAVHGQFGALQVHKRGCVDAVGRSALEFAFDDSEALRTRIAQVEGVTAVAARIGFGALLTNAEAAPASRARSSWLVVTAVEPEAERRVTPRRFALIGEGGSLSAADAREVLLQADVAAGLGAVPSAFGVDDSAWPALLANDEDGAANGEVVRVVGTLQSPLPGDCRFALVPLTLAQRLLRLEGRVTEYGLAIDSAEHLRDVQRRLESSLGPDYEVHGWDQLMPLLKELHGYQDAVFGMLSTLLLVVVLLTAVNNMLMNVLERVREIGMLLAMGLRRRQIAVLFLLEGALLGAAGGGIGALLGGAAVIGLNALGLTLTLAGTSTPAQLQFQVSPLFLASVAMLACASTVIAAVWPARTASRLAPIVALRTR